MTPAELGSLNIAILGVGREGQAARSYLRGLFPDKKLTLISESAPDRALAAQLNELDELFVGPLSGAGLESFDILVRSPGFSPYRRSIVSAKSAGARVTSPSNLWFAAHPTEKTVCITGTKGKSTTSALLAHVLKSLGNRVRLAGNIGLPLLACDDRNVDWWVIELSSYQLADLEAAPRVSVILNLSAEHLDWHGSEAAYRDDKLRLADLSGGAALIANAADPILRDRLGGRPGVVWFNRPEGVHVVAGGIRDGSNRLDLAMPSGLPGRHNLANAAAAVAALKVIGIEPRVALREISSFRSLPHRLQIVGVRDGVSFVNDSISSTPVATVAALEAYSGQAVTLIVGGLDRGLDWERHAAGIARWLPSAIVAIPDNGPLILESLRRAGIEPRKGLHEAADLRQAIALARELSSSGGVIMLSPGAPSFPQFEDYRERGRKFAGICGFELEERDLWQE